MTTPKNNLGWLTAWAFVLILFLSACSVSKVNQVQVEKAVDRFVAEWKSGDLDGIHNNSDQQFRKITLSDWLAWKTSIDQDWGSLQSAKIVEIKRLVPDVGIYQAVTDMRYDRGTTRGSLTFSMLSNTPRLLGAVLIDATSPRPFE